MDRRAVITLVSLLSVAPCACGPALVNHGRAPAPVAPIAPIASDPDDRCVHGVPCETCVLCHPALAEKFKAAGDWCPEHNVPESQCAICHPEVAVAPPAAPAGADVRHLSDHGEDVPALAPLAVPGKVTIFDFYADWCGPCRKIDAHVFSLLATRTDVAYRKLNIVSWDTPLARHHLAGVPSLPYVVVYGKNNKPVNSISGLQLDTLDRAIAAGSAQ